MQDFPGVTEARLLGAKHTEKYIPKHRSFSLMTKALLQKNYFSMQKTILQKMKGLIKKCSLVSLYFVLIYCAYQFWLKVTGSYIQNL